MGYRRIVLAATAVAVASAVSVIGAAPPSAQAARDTTPPRVSVAASPFIKVGTVETGSAPPVLPMNVTWTASDASGICTERVDTVYYFTDGSDDGDDPGVRETWPVAPTARQVTIPFNLDAYYYNVSVSVTDCAGNTGIGGDTYWPYKNGEAEWPIDHPDWTPLDVSLSTGWSASSCTCWSGGRTLKSSRAGSTLTFTRHNIYGEVLPIRNVALISDRAPDRGVAKVYVDGRLDRKVSFKGTTANRMVMWSKRWSTFTPHTISVVVVSGRVDVDAFVINDAE